MQEVIKKLETLLDEYTGMLHGIPEDEFSFKLSAVKWSKKEILGHLVDSAQNNIQRFVRVQYEKAPHIIYNQDVWVVVQYYKNYHSKALITLWGLLNKHICIIITHTSVEAYTRLCGTGRGKERLYALEFVAKDYIAHPIHHLNQIFNN